MYVKNHGHFQCKLFLRLNFPIFYYKIQGMLQTFIDKDDIIPSIFNVAKIMATLVYNSLAAAPLASRSYTFEWREIYFKCLKSY